MNTGHQETAETFLKRKQKNLEFFRSHVPVLYKRFSSLLMKRVELVVSPAEVDVDLHVDGKSLYGGRAKYSALQEIEQFLGKYPAGKRLQTMSPPKASGHGKPRFANRALQTCLQSISDEDTAFTGYPIPDFFPFFVFLGCGLGYQIESMIKRVDVVSAVIFEPDEEQFAASLFTVDWDVICRKFTDRKGYSIKFIIGKESSSETELKKMLEVDLRQMLPLYPAMTFYLNHRESAVNQRIMSRVKEDLPKIFANWGNYDDEMIRLNNTAFNLRESPQFLVNETSSVYNRPVVIAGSGPSIDDRIQTIIKCRREITLVSAGTALKGLIAAGLKPDYHVEIDPHYVIYQLLSEIGKENLAGITLIAVNEINALVPPLFDDVYFYAKTDNPAPRVFGLERFAFQHCNPTCTNAAFAVFQQMGFKNFFLFGTDYGFRDRERHHSDNSVYGSRDENSQVSRRLNDVARKVFLEGRLITVDAVDGGSIYTRPDYYSARASVEDMLDWAGSQHPDLIVRNCSDGAVIKGAEWLPRDEFEPLVKQLLKDTESQSSLDILAHTLGRYQSDVLDKQLGWIHKGVKQRASDLRALVANRKLRGKKDVTRLVSELVKTLTTAHVPKGYSMPQAEQVLARHLLWGTGSHFLTAGFCYAMASSTDEEAAEIADAWRDSFLNFLDHIDDHFQSIIIDDANGEGKQWLSKAIDDAETAVEEAG